MGGNEKLYGALATEGGGSSGSSNGEDGYLIGQNGINGKGGGGGGGQNTGGDGGSGIVIIRYRNVPEQIENEKQITLTWDSNQFNKLVYDFFPYNDLISWKQYAKNNGFNYQFTHWNANRIWEYSSEGVPKARHITSRGFIELKLNNDYDYVIVEFSIPDATNIGVVNETAYVNLFMYDNGSHKESEWNDKYNSENSTQIKGTWWHKDYKDQPLKFESAYTKDQSIRIVEYESSISKNIKITLLKRIIIYNVVLPVNTIVFLNGNKATLNTGTYDIIMGPLGCEIRNRVTKNLIGNYKYRYGNKLEFKYPITKTLQQLHDDSTSFSGTIYTIGMSDQKYSLGKKTLGTIKKYRVYIYKRLLNHNIQLYVDDKLLNKGTDYITGNDEDAITKTINLHNLYITINKNIAGIIYLKSDKPIFFISETNRTSFNNTTDAIFGTNVNNLKASGSGTLSSLNDIFRVSEANTALTTAQNRKITYNINTILESPLTISYNSSTINPAGKNSLDNLMTTYNNIHRYNESSGGALTEKINEYTFGNILNPAETDIEKYISYEYPTAPTDDKLTPSTRNTPFNIRSNATKYVYFRKSS
ncbi:MAG: hypothetical protein EBU84_11015 [Actinobacteria bacterium]|nr:hypothetical protein [Actinomycetota bacterium]